MKLASLLPALPGFELIGSGNVDIRSIELDSRRVGGGALFVCLDGLARNGHDFAAAAVNQGAVALVVDHRVEGAGEATQVVVPDTREAMARLSAAFYGHPSRSLTVIGVTGTNGKTTVTHLLEGIAEESGHTPEVLGTLGSRTRGSYRPTGFTTPESPGLQRILREAADRGAGWVAMEVSSHALAQKRTFGTDFAAVVFTNLTRDHLDYHRTMDAYLEAKLRLFTRAGRGSERDAVAVVNLEDPAGPQVSARADGRVATYGFGGGVDYRARRVRTGPRGTRYELITPRGREAVEFPLLGRFNVLNALAAQAAAMELGADLGQAVRGVRRVHRVRGRMEPVPGSHPFLVLIDYAHTPDGLAHALRAARAITSRDLIVVFGCGGDRDPGKRAEMGRIAAGLGDRVIATSDNPRHEDPEAILDAILEGAAGGPARVTRIADRAAAITAALGSARPGDTVLVAGKGHETVQIVGDEERPFDDREVVTRTLTELGFHVDDRG